LILTASLQLKVYSEAVDMMSLYKCHPQGTRKRGRPKNSWRRSVIKEAGRSWNELRFLAADRKKWKELVDNLRS
jgi:hypothetical protein